MAGLEQAFRHGQAHAAGSDPADLLCILRHHETLPLKSWRLESARAGALAVLPQMRQWRIVPKPDTARACGERSKRTILRPRPATRPKKGPRSGGHLAQIVGGTRAQMQDAVTAITADHGSGRSQAGAAPAADLAQYFSFRCRRRNLGDHCLDRRFSTPALSDARRSDDLLRESDDHGHPASSRHRNSHPPAHRICPRRHRWRHHRCAHGPLAPRRGYLSCHSYRSAPRSPASPTRRCSCSGSDSAISRLSCWSALSRLFRSSSTAGPA